MSKETIGTRIKLVREACNLTQEELADLIETSKGTITNIERNVHEPKIHQLIKIADVTNVRITELIYGNDWENLTNDIEREMRKYTDELLRLSERDQEIILEILGALILNAKNKMRYAREKKPKRA